MKFLLITLMSVNFLLIVSFFYGITNIFNDKTPPKTRAFYSIFLSILLFIYLILIVITGFQYMLGAHYSAVPFMFMFFAFPFIGGKFASYQKLEFFSYLQIGIFFLSLLYFVYLYANL